MNFVNVPVVKIWVSVIRGRERERKCWRVQKARGLVIVRSQIASRNIVSVLMQE